MIAYVFEHCWIEEFDSTKFRVQVWGGVLCSTVGGVQEGGTLFTFLLYFYLYIHVYCLFLISQYNLITNKVFLFTIENSCRSSCDLTTARASIRIHNKMFDWLNKNFTMLWKLSYGIFSRVKMAVCSNQNKFRKLEGFCEN